MLILDMGSSKTSPLKQAEKLWWESNSEGKGIGAFEAGGRRVYDEYQRLIIKHGPPINDLVFNELTDFIAKGIENE